MRDINSSIRCISILEFLLQRFCLWSFAVIIVSRSRAREFSSSSSNDIDPLSLPCQRASKLVLVYKPVAPSRRVGRPACTFARCYLLRVPSVKITQISDLYTLGETDVRFSRHAQIAREIRERLIRKKISAYKSNNERRTHACYLYTLSNYKQY